MDLLGEIALRLAAMSGVPSPDGASAAAGAIAASESTGPKGVSGAAGDDARLAAVEARHSSTRPAAVNSPRTERVAALAEHLAEERDSFRYGGGDIAAAGAPRWIATLVAYRLPSGGLEQARLQDEDIAELYRIMLGRVRFFGLPIDPPSAHRMVREAVAESVAAAAAVWARPPQERFYGLPDVISELLSPAERGPVVSPTPWWITFFFATYRRFDDDAQRDDEIARAVLQYRQELRRLRERGLPPELPAAHLLVRERMLRGEGGVLLLWNDHVVPIDDKSIAYQKRFHERLALRARPQMAPFSTRDLGDAPQWVASFALHGAQALTRQDAIDRVADLAHNYRDGLKVLEGYGYLPSDQTAHRLVRGAINLHGGDLGEVMGKEAAGIEDVAAMARSRLGGQGARRAAAYVYGLSRGPKDMEAAMGKLLHEFDTAVEVSVRGTPLGRRLAQAFARDALLRAMDVDRLEQIDGPMISRRVLRRLESLHDELDHRGFHWRSRNIVEIGGEWLQAEDVFRAVEGAVKMLQRLGWSAGPASGAVGGIVEMSGGEADAAVASEAAGVAAVQPAGTAAMPGSIAATNGVVTSSAIAFVPPRTTMVK